MTEPAHDDVELVDPLIGRVLAERYRMLRKVGVGGMGSIYEAEHVALGRHVAVKILHAQYASDAEVVKRFRNEGRAASRIGHPNIVECLDFGRTAEGAPFLVMEFLEGRSLADVMVEEGALPVGRAARIGRQIASALAAAHDAHIVHRDVKPENVFLCRRDDNVDHAKVVDFGISKFDGALSAATRTGAVLGSPNYMAPEQIHDASRADGRTDVYALGAILYQMLTGVLPFVAKSFPALVVAITTDEPEPIDTFRSDVPPDLIALVRQAMAKDAADRVPNMRSFAERLNQFVRMDMPPQLRERPEPSESTPAGPFHSSVRSVTPQTQISMADIPTRRAGWLWALVVGGLLAVGVAVAVTLLGGRDEAPVEPAPEVAGPASVPAPVPEPQPEPQEAEAQQAATEPAATETQPAPPAPEPEPTRMTTTAMTGTSQMATTMREPVVTAMQQAEPASMEEAATTMEPTVRVRGGTPVYDDYE